MNIAEKIKDCKEKTFYTTIIGDVRLLDVSDDPCDVFPIKIESLYEDKILYFTINGKYSIAPGAECVLFPSRANRDWNNYVK